MKSGDQLNASMMASFMFNRDVSFLFPYLNAVAKRVELYEEPSFIRFTFNGARCVLYPERCLATPFDDREDVGLFLERFLSFLNKLDKQRDKIVPRYKFFQQVSVLEILRILPQSNCGECGFPTCMTFAAMLSKQQTIPGRCPHLGLPLNEQAMYPVHDNEGNLLSTVTINIDMNKSNIELQQYAEYIDKLEKKISELSGFRVDAEKTANRSLPSPLTGREIEVLRMLACGVTNLEISELLSISPHTVKSHVIHIFNKLGVNTRTQAAVWAARHNLV